MPGFDDRLLIKVELREDAQVPDLNAIPGVELISQEDKSVVLAFATEDGLTAFEQRMTNLARDGRATRADLLYALQGFDSWRPEDRKGPALRVQGFPDRQTFLLDVELWPQERNDRRDAILNNFLTWMAQNGISRLDDLKQPSLIMVRVRSTRAHAETLLLHHRDVRTVDLPPQLGIPIETMLSDINRFPPPDAPPAQAPAIAVLDAGITTGHPLLAGAIGDAQGYLSPQRQSADEGPRWHGTFVSGLALYGDVGECLRQHRFAPSLRLFSGKVFQDDGHDQDEFVEKAIEEAVRELNEQYGCKVFNLSYGDTNKVYDGRHVRGLAYTLDRLSRELDVLFVVPTGNVLLTDLPENPRQDYPQYILADSARILDPAPALNALTVGGLAKHTATTDAQRYENHIEDLPIAQTDQPFPLTRSGFSINDAIKPDLVEHAGNLATMRAANRVRYAGMGLISTSGDFVAGRPFSQDIGTSYAAPLVAHRAARLVGELPNVSANLLRCLLGSHARWPKACTELFNPAETADGRTRQLRVIGYGQVDEDALYRSIDQTVTLLAEDRIDNNKCHFYELPIPTEYWSRGRRNREITVALAYSPEVRTTRLDYRMSKLWFTFVVAPSLDNVSAAFQRNREEGMSERSTGRWLTNADRKQGTLQVSRWTFKQPIDSDRRVFVVVTRQDTSWGSTTDIPEPYALTVVLADRENSSVNLYALVQTQIAQKAQARARARL